MTEGPDIPFEQSDAVRDLEERAAVGFVHTWYLCHDSSQPLTQELYCRFLDALGVNAADELCGRLAADGKIARSIVLVSGEIVIEEARP